MLTRTATSNASQNITSMQFTTAFQAPADGQYRGDLRVSGMNGAGANMTVWLRHSDASNTKIRDILVTSASAKLTAADTVWGISVGPVIIRAGEKLQVGVLSSNASDTATTLAVDWADISRSSTPN